MNSSPLPEVFKKFKAVLQKPNDDEDLLILPRNSPLEENCTAVITPLSKASKPFSRFKRLLLFLLMFIFCAVVYFLIGSTFYNTVPSIRWIWARFQHCEICIEVSNLTKSSMDESLSPCNDFFGYACGNWEKFHEIQDSNEDDVDVLRELGNTDDFNILNILENPPNFSGATAKAQNFYLSCVAHKESTSFPNILSAQEKLLCAKKTHNYFPDVVARLFVSKMYSWERKEKIQFIFNQISATYQAQLSNLRWMDETTRRKVSADFAKIKTVLGYPEEIMDFEAESLKYENVNISRYGEDYFDNFDKLESLYIGRILSFSENDYTDIVAEANAFYSFKKDELVVLAGISQQPLYHPDYPDFLNYGKFGVIIAHELGHALQHYVEISSTVAVLKGFEKLQQCFVQEYNGFPIKNTNLVPDGKETWSENFADCVGVEVAFKTFEKQDIEGKNHKVLPGFERFTKEQMFFIGAAQMYCRHFKNYAARESVLSEQIENDPHSPNSIRVLGEMANFDDFAKAFNCPVGSNYNPVKKCKVFS